MTLNELIDRLVLKLDKNPKLGETEVTARLFNGNGIELRCTERDEDNDTDDELAYKVLRTLTGVCDIELENPPVPEGDDGWI